MSLPASSTKRSDPWFCLSHTLPRTSHAGAAAVMQTLVSLAAKLAESGAKWSSRSTLQDFLAHVEEYQASSWSYCKTHAFGTCCMVSSHHSPDKHCINRNLGPSFCARHSKHHTAPEETISKHRRRHHVGEFACNEILAWPPQRPPRCCQSRAARTELQRTAEGSCFLLSHSFL